MMRRINLVLVLSLFAVTAYAQNEPRLSLPPAKTSDIESASGFARAGVPSGADPDRYVMSNEVMIRWSEANDAAWGFSKSLGRWAKQEINPPADQAPGGSEPATFIVGDKVAVWRVGSSYYAYSGQTGRWDVLRLPEGRAPKPLVYDNLVFVNDTDNDYAFAASTGRWSSPNDSDTDQLQPTDWDPERKRREIEGQHVAAQESLGAITQQLTTPNSGLSPQARIRLEAEQARLRVQLKSYAEQLKLTDQRLAVPSRASDTARSDAATDSNPVDPQIKIFTLRHAKANDARHLIEQLFPRDIQSIAADVRSNSLIVRGPPEPLNIIFAILTRLDEDLGGNQTTAGNRWPAPPGPGRSTTGSADSGLPSPTQVAELSQQYDAKEQQAAALARQIRDLQSAPQDHKRPIEEMTSSLRRAVADSFAARQKLQQAEVAQLQQRIAAIQQSLQTRQKLSEKIIEHRVKDLLDPDLQWDKSSRPQAGTSATTSSRTSTTGTPQPKVAGGFWWGPETELILSALGLPVKKLTRDDAPDPTLVGAMKIVAIDPNSPAKELHVGDLILGLQSTGGSGKGMDRVELHVRRGNHNFPVFVESPSEPSAPTARPAPRGTITYPATNNLEAARAYRDKLGERWNEIEQLFQAGRVPLSEALQAATQLSQAELEAAANTDERLAARRQAVDRLKAIQAIIDPRVAEHSEPTRSKFAVDAALIKAEADLASDATPSAQPSAQPGAKTNSQLEPVSVNWMNRNTTDIIWDVLGVKVQDITPESVRKYGYSGGLLIDEVQSGAAHGLRPGDVILGVHHWETTHVSHLAWVLLQPISKNVSVTNPSARASIESATIRFLRGETVQSVQVMLPAWSLPESGKFGSPFGRQPPLRSSSATTSQRESLPPTLNLPLAGETTTLRAPDDFRRRLATAVSGLERVKSLLERGRDGQTESARVESQQAIERAERDLAFVREEFAAQIRLLELEFQDAESAVSTAIQQREETLEAFRSGRAKRDNTIASERALQEAKIRLQRAKTLLDLYRKADPTPSPAEAAPQNKPATSPT